ncbi:hypothetical protein CDAR_264211 [Caerostris darwini]|uniref:Uncharacterized protein n=1 Tax=Caerostris darwini TaxID=1538125 RepID=A0AAV4X1B7_9ARAC|nr:hypothetical protein CDAR_264211 [Caerostris darwini]
MHYIAGNFAPEVFPEIVSNLRSLPFPIYLKEGVFLKTLASNSKPPYLRRTPPHVFGKNTQFRVTLAVLEIALIDFAFAAVFPKMEFSYLLFTFVR